jgi:hypothetical protein
VRALADLKLNQLFLGDKWLALDVSKRRRAQHLLAKLLQQYRDAPVSSKARPANDDFMVATFFCVARDDCEALSDEVVQTTIAKLDKGRGWSTKCIPIEVWPVHKYGKLTHTHADSGRCTRYTADQLYTKLVAMLQAEPGAWLIPYPHNTHVKRGAIFYWACEADATPKLLQCD